MTIVSAITMRATKIAPTRASIHRQAGVVFRERARGGFRRRHVVELGELPSPVEVVLAIEAVEHLRHPPGETLRLPHAAQAGGRIAFEPLGAAGPVELNHCPRQEYDVGKREVHAL